MNRVGWMLVKYIIKLFTEQKIKWKYVYLLSDDYIYTHYYVSMITIIKEVIYINLISQVRKRR